MSNILLTNLAMGEEIRPSLVSLKEECKDAKKALALHADEAYDAKLFVNLLKNEDAKVRKNTAQLMGLLGDAEFADVLMKGYLEEQTLFARAGYLKALEAFDCTPFRDDLQMRLTMLTSETPREEDVKHIAEEIRALRRLLPQNTGENHIYKEPGSPIRVVLTTTEALKEKLLDEVKRITGEESSIMPLGVMTKSARLEKLAALRFYKELLFPLNGLKASEKNKLCAAIIEGDLFRTLNLLHEASETPYRFRVQTSSKNLDMVRLAGQIEAYAKGRLINNASNYEIELRMVEKKDGSFLTFLKTYTRKDSRFTYRKDVVATSMHPVKAAGMVYKVKTYLKPHAQILDPYCGVGTLLIERDLAVCADHIYGTDIFGDAIVGARANTAAAKMLRRDARGAEPSEINYIHRNYYDFKSEYLFDEIITEMPRFTKDEADGQYRKFFEKGYELLAPKGLILMDSVEKGLVHKYLRLLGDKYRLVREIAFQKKDDENIYIIERLN